MIKLTDTGTGDRILVNPAHILMVVEMKIEGRLLSGICFGYRPNGEPLVQSVQETMGVIEEMLSDI